jgi:DNA-binding Lrp family transcriptional regulator
MDRYDALILHALQDDGRIRWSRLAKRVNLSASACQRRVEALEEQGVISGFTSAVSSTANY